MDSPLIYSLLAVIGDALYEDLLIYSDAEIAVWDRTVELFNDEGYSAVLPPSEMRVLTTLAARAEAALAAAPETFPLFF